MKFNNLRVSYKLWSVILGLLLLMLPLQHGHKYGPGRRQTRPNGWCRSMRTRSPMR